MNCLQGLQKYTYVALLALLLSIPRTIFAFEIVFEPSDIPFDTIGAMQQLAGTILQSEDFTKEFVLDPLAWINSQAALQASSQSMVNWVASGFNGSPGFVTNLAESRLNVGDEAAEDFIRQLQNDGRIHSPISSQIISEVRDAYYKNTGTGVYVRTNPYTLDESCENDEAFFDGDFMACGFSGLRTVLLNPLANTPEGSRIAIMDAVFNRVSDQQEVLDTELGWAGGVLSWRGPCGGGDEGQEQGAGGTATEATSIVSLSSASNMIGCAIQTPGSVVLAELTNQIGIGAEQSANADEISELIGSAFFQFVQDQIFGEGGIAGQGANSGTSRPTQDDGLSQSTPTGIIGAFTRTIESQLTRVEEYVTVWRKIQTQAEIAKENLSQCRGTTAQILLNNEVIPLLTKADEVLSTMAEFVLILSDILARAESATDFVSFEEVMDDYNNLLSRNPPYENVSILESADYIEALQQSQDSQGTIEPTPAYERMKELSDSCFASS